jgi:excisionase family DNA binding protein
MANEIENLLTVKAAAEILRVNPSRVRQFILAGRIKSFKMGLGHLIHRDEIDRFIKEDRDRRTTRWQRERGKP